MDTNVVEQPAHRRRQNAGLLGDPLNQLPFPVQQDGWHVLCRRIQTAQVVPLIGNMAFDEWIFAPLIDQYDQLSKMNADQELDGTADATSQPASADTGLEPRVSLTINERLSRSWAMSIDYPLLDMENLARVALYNRYMKAKDDDEAKNGFFQFIKYTLLNLFAQVNRDKTDLVNRLQRAVDDMTVSRITSELGILDRENPNLEPLRQLAGLNLPIYVTTSHYDFLEQIIQQQGRKNVRTEVCDVFNLGMQNQDDQKSLHATAEVPVVYHLHGIETKPSSVVLSEDDYLLFLRKIAQLNTQHPLIPLDLDSDLTEKALMMLGYRLRDWDFRTLFHGLIVSKEMQRQNSSVAIQLSPRQQRDSIEPADAECYLASYFEKKAKFEVKWFSSTHFMKLLWEKWNVFRGGGAL